MIKNYKGVDIAPLGPVCIHCTKPVPAGSIVCVPCAVAGDTSAAPREYGYGCVRCGGPVPEPQTWCEVCR